MTITDLLTRIAWRVNPPKPRPITAAAIAEVIAQYPAAVFEAARVEIAARASERGENVYHFAMAFKPYIWAEMYNRAHDDEIQLGALVMLDIHARYERGDYVMTYKAKEGVTA